MYKWLTDGEQKVKDNVSSNTSKSTGYLEKLVLVILKLSSWGFQDLRKYDCCEMDHYKNCT